MITSGPAPGSGAPPALLGAISPPRPPRTPGPSERTGKPLLYTRLLRPPSPRSSPASTAAAALYSAMCAPSRFRRGLRGHRGRARLRSALGARGRAGGGHGAQREAGGRCWAAAPAEGAG